MGSGLETVPPALEYFDEVVSFVDGGACEFQMAGAGAEMVEILSESVVIVAGLPVGSSAGSAKVGAEAVAEMFATAVLCCRQEFVGESAGLAAGQPDSFAAESAMVGEAASRVAQMIVVDDCYGSDYYHYY